MYRISDPNTGYEHTTQPTIAPLAEVARHLLRILYNKHYKGSPPDLIVVDPRIDYTPVNTPELVTITPDDTSITLYNGIVIRRVEWQSVIDDDEDEDGNEDDED